jgi:uncharacterized protein (TIGR03086 family)
MSRALELYRSLAGDFTARVDAVPPDAWDRQSPCEEWKARDVVIHAIGVSARSIKQANGVPLNQEGFAAIDEAAAERIGDGSPDALVKAWHDTRAEMEEVLADPARAQQMMPGMGGEMPFEQIVARFICTDVLVHTWDLARAAGLDEKLNQEAVAHAYEGIKPMDAMIRVPGAFGPKVEPPEGADLQTEFLCFLGRPV